MVSSTQEAPGPELCSWQLVKKGNWLSNILFLKLLWFFYDVYISKLEFVRQTFFFVDYLVLRNQIDSKALVGCWNWSCQAPLKMQKNKNLWVGLLWVQAYEFHLLGVFSLPQSNQKGYYYADTRIFFYIAFGCMQIAQKPCSKTGEIPGRVFLFCF